MVIDAVSAPSVTSTAIRTLPSDPDCGVNRRPVLPLIRVAVPDAGRGLARDNVSPSTSAADAKDSTSISTAVLYGVVVVKLLAVGASLTAANTNVRVPVSDPPLPSLTV